MAQARRAEHRQSSGIFTIFIGSAGILMRCSSDLECSFFRIFVGFSRDFIGIFMVQKDAFRVFPGWDLKDVFFII